MAHTTVKISQLPSASHSDITSATAVLPIIDGSITKKITVDNLFGTATDITASGNISSSGTITAVTGAFSHLIGNSPITVASQLKFGGQSGAVDINLGVNSSGGDAKLLNANDIPLIEPIVEGTFTVGSQGSGRTEFGGAHEVELYAKGAVKILSTDGDDSNSIGSYILLGSGSLSGTNLKNTDQHTIRFGSGSGGNLGHHPTIGDFYGGTDTVVFNTAKGHITASGNISASGNIKAPNFTTPKGGQLNVNTGQIKSVANSDTLFIDGTDSSNITFNDQETDVDIKIRGAGGNYYFKADADAEKVGIGGNFNTTVPGEALTVHGNISASGNISATNLTLVGDATINGNLTFGNSTSDSVAFGAEISSSIIPDANNAYALGSPTRRWSSVFANSSSFNYISASTIDVNADTIRIGGTSFSKTELDNLKGGKSISTIAAKQVVHGGDDSTFVQMKPNAPGRVIHKVSNISLFDMQTSSFAIGDPAGNVPIFLQAKNLSLSGSTTVSGSFTVTDLLTVLANYGQTGSFSVSGSTTLDGDVNADGAVTVTDLLTVLGGFGVSGSCAVSGALEISGSIIAGSPPALVITGSTSTTGSFDIGGNTTITGSFEQSGSSTFTGGGFVVNDLLNLLANFGNSGLPTGSGAGNVSAGDINLDGQVNVNDLLLLLAGYGNPSLLSTNLTIPPNTNYQLIGPQITVSQSIVVTVGSSSFFQIT